MRYLLPMMEISITNWYLHDLIRFSVCLDTLLLLFLPFSQITTIENNIKSQSACVGVSFEVDYHAQILISNKPFFIWPDFLSIWTMAEFLVKIGYPN